MTVKEYIDAIVKLSDEHAEAVERLKKKLGGLLADMEEQHKQAEPLIKDEKIRKAVRAWWESIPCEPADKLVLYKKNQDLAVGVYTIYCGAIYPEGTLKEGKKYTIAELCGEEEE